MNRQETPQVVSQPEGAEGVLAPGGAASAVAMASVEAGAGGAGEAGWTAKVRRLGQAVFPSGTSLRALAMRGSVWTILMYGAGQVVGLVTNWALAELLPAAAFGLMAIVKVVLQGLRMFSDIGIGPSIIQNERGDDPVFLNTAWTIQIIRGFALWLGAGVLAWPAAVFYNEPMLIPLLIASGFTATIAGFHSPALFTLNRKLYLGRLNALGLFSMVVSNGVMVALAWATGSVWALVVGGIVSAAIMLILSHRAIPQERVRVMWDRSSAGTLIRFGKWIFLSTMITFLAGQLDKLMLGKLMTMAELGVYGIALSVAMVPSAVCGQLAVSVLYPVLSEHARTDRALLAPKLLRARGLILPVSIFAMLAVITGSPVLFGYIYRPEFADAGWIAQLVSIPMWFIMLQLTADRAVLAAGDSRALAASNVWKLVLTGGGAMIGFMAAGLPGFILGVGAGALAGHVRVQAALLRLGANIVWQDLRYTALIGVLGAAAAFGPRVWTGGAWTGTPDLTALLVTAAVVLTPVAAWVGWVVRREVFRT